jgi:hypothetical protein
VDNIKMDLGEIEWGGMDWIGLARGRYQRRARVKMVKTTVNIFKEKKHRD